MAEATIRLLFLGKLSDLAGMTETSIEVEDHALDWADLCAMLEGRYSAALVAAIGEDSVRLARNGRLLADKASLHAVPGDEIALLPPVSGG